MSIQFFLKGLICLFFLSLIGCESGDKYNCTAFGCITYEDGNYSNMEDCIDDCGSNVSGYDCVSGNCVESQTGAAYADKAACELRCNSGGAGYNCNNGNCTYVSSGATYEFLTDCQKNCSNSSGAGYNCNNGNCVSVSSGATYTSLADCQSNCSNSGTGGAGYKCVNGNCTSVTSGSNFATLSDCQNACRYTGMINVKLYRKPGGSCAANDVNHNLVFYYLCEHGEVHGGTSPSAGIWTYGTDADGYYSTCLFGAEQSMLCKHGTTLKNRIYKLEWEATPQKSSYPISCKLSGVANIDFQNQQKNVIIKWN